MCNDYLYDSLQRYVGRTVTIFTTSGGLSGSGFTGVLAGIHNGTVKLITDIGAAPACPLGSSCGGFCGGYNYGGSNWLGSVTEIPIDKIASFTHSAI